ncbi:MAG: radical SAM protein [Acidobacteriota bacterium]
MDGLDSARIRALRSPKPRHDPWSAQGLAVEQEPQPDGTTARALTVFLTGAECPFTCVFCDLWRHTLDEPTPPGAIPRQIRAALAAPEAAGATTIKLYNASNYFDRRAVPAEDDTEVARLVGGFRRVVVEAHPKLVGRRCRTFIERLGAATLEVAMGFESLHPWALERSGKGVTVDDLRRAAARLREWGAALRAFVLIGAPFVPAAERVASTVETVETALALGAVRVSLVPVRGGNGALDVLRRRGSWHPPTLDEVEATLARCLPLAPNRVAVDPWDLEALADPSRPDDAARVERLRRLAAGEVSA